MKEWFTGNELSQLDVMPNSSRAVAVKAKRNNWLSRRVASGSGALEYHISNFHEDAKKEIFEKLVTLPKGNVSRVMPIDAVADWCSLPVYDVHAAAGAGTLVQSEYQIGTFQIPCELLHEYGLNEENSSIIFVDGDSMEPTLNHKDKLLVDISEQHHPASSGVYVIRIDDAVYVKRLYWDIENGLYNVISDNLKYASFKIDHTNGRNFKIIGKAITTIMKPVL